MHFLLFTPFRYLPPKSGSRFRGVTDPGVFYGADEIRTACAELGYWRWRFLMDSPKLEKIAPQSQTLFQTAVKGLTVDLRAPPFDQNNKAWTDPDLYIATQNFAVTARTAGISLIRYQSVRDPKAGGCGAVLTPAAFTNKNPLQTQAWWLSIARQRIMWQHEFNGMTFEFDMQGIQ